MYMCAGFFGHKGGCGAAKVATFQTEQSCKGWVRTGVATKVRHPGLPQGAKVWGNKMRQELLKYFKQTSQMSLSCIL